MIQFEESALHQEKKSLEEQEICSNQNQQKKNK